MNEICKKSLGVCITNFSASMSRQLKVLVVGCLFGLAFSTGGVQAETIGASDAGKKNVQIVVRTRTLNVPVESLRVLQLASDDNQQRSHRLAAIDQMVGDKHMHFVVGGIEWSRVGGVGREILQNVSVEQRRGQLTLIGRRAIQMPTQNGGQWQQIFVQEFRISLPFNAVAGGWDVRSLERELERLGVKVKPKPSAPRPTPQLSG